MALYLQQSGLVLIRTCLHSYNGCSVFSSLMTVPKQRSCVFEDRAKCGTRTWTPISETEHALQQSNPQAFSKYALSVGKHLHGFLIFHKDTYGIRNTGGGTGKGEKAVSNPTITFNRIVRSKRQSAVRALAVESSQPAVHVSVVIVELYSFEVC